MILAVFEFASTRYNTSIRLLSPLVLQVTTWHHTLAVFLTGQLTCKLIYNQSSGSHLPQFVKYATSFNLLDAIDR